MSVLRTDEILLIDDDESILRLLSHFLTNSGYKVTAFSDPIKGFEYYRTHSTTVGGIILDWNMPVLNGLALLEKINALENRGYAPVIFLTARDSLEDIQKGLEAGAFFYLVKPFEERLLRITVQFAVTEFQNKINARITEQQSLLFRNMLKKGTFRLRTPEEAESLSLALSQRAKDPMMTRLGLGELLYNAIEHGNLAISYDEKTQFIRSDTFKEEVARRLNLEAYKDRFVTVEYTIEEKAITFEIIDQGAGFNFKEYLQIAKDRFFDYHGKGIAMAKRLSFQELNYFEPGNRVVAKVYL